MCMNVLSWEEEDIMIKNSAEHIIPSSVDGYLKVHHEDLEIDNLKQVIESVGGEIHK